MSRQVRLGIGRLGLCGCLLIWLGAVGLRAQAEGEANQVLHFKNGDVLAGRLTGFRAGQGLGWQRPDLGGEVRFLPDRLQAVEFSAVPAAPETTGGRPDCQVEMTNGDLLEGRLESVDSKVVVLQDTPAGTLRIPRENVTMLVPLSEAPDVIYSGPTGLDGWTIGEVRTTQGEGDVWKYNQGAFFAREAASIARIVGLPQEGAMDFEIRWIGTFNLAVALYTDFLQPISLGQKEQEPKFGDFYSLQLNTHAATLLLVQQHAPLKQIGRVAVPVFRNRNQARIGIRVSQADASIYLLVDGQMIHKWTDPEGFHGAGRGIRLVHQGQGAIRFSALEIRDWDGRLMPMPQMKPEIADDLVAFLSRDLAVGRVVGYQDGVFIFQGEKGEIKIPRQRILQVEFAGTTRRVPPESKSGVRLWFQGAAPARLTVQLESWQAEEVKGTSSILGPVTLKPASVSLMEFSREK